MFNKFNIKKVFITLFILTISLSFVIKKVYFTKKLPTQAVKLEDIKSVQFVNLDRAKDRRGKYEKMLKNNFGEHFLNHKIGNNIRLSGVDGKKDLVFENIDTQEKIMYQQAQNKELEILGKGIYKVYSQKNPKIYVYFSNVFGYSDVKKTFNIIYNKYGNLLSFITAFYNISKQKEGTYGFVFEDDFLIDKDFYNKVEMALQTAPQDFDLLKMSISHTDMNKGYKKIPRGIKNLLRIANSYRKYGYGDYVDAKIKKRHSFVAGNQFIVVSQKGATKLLNYYKNHISYNGGSDDEFWWFIPNIDKNISSYIYIREVPVLLSEDSEKSQIE